MRKQITSGKYRSFMPRPENEQRLALASRLGINISELINDSLAANLEKQLQEKLKALQTELASADTTFTREWLAGIGDGNGGCEISSVVEHFLHTEGVAGSNPASRTIAAKRGITFKVRLVKKRDVGTLHGEPEMSAAGISSAATTELPARIAAGSPFQANRRRGRHRVDSGKATGKPQTSLSQIAFALSGSLRRAV